ncbi:MAG: hypothetical protein RR982_06655 [Kiritimatiellia bacterium]
MRRYFYSLAALFLCSVASAACAVCGPSSEVKLFSLRAHHCLSAVFGSARQEGDTTLIYNGFQWGLIHSSMAEDDVLRTFIDERCDVNGVSLQLLTTLNNGTVNGVAVTGIFSGIRAVDGVQLSGLACAANTVRGVQLSLAMSRANEAATGVQVGLVTYAQRLKGVQFGLLNINQSGLILPLINVSW